MQGFCFIWRTCWIKPL